MNRQQIVFQLSSDGKLHYCVLTEEGMDALKDEVNQEFSSIPLVLQGCC